MVLVTVVRCVPLVVVIVAVVNRTEVTVRGTTCVSVVLPVEATSVAVLIVVTVTGGPLGCSPGMYTTPQLGPPTAPLTKFPKKSTVKIDAPADCQSNLAQASLC